MIPGLGRPPLEMEIATHARILAWGIPWMEEPGGLQSLGPHRVGYAWNNNTAHMDGEWTFSHVNISYLLDWCSKKIRMPPNNKTSQKAFQTSIKHLPMTWKSKGITAWEKWTLPGNCVYRLIPWVYVCSWLVRQESLMIFMLIKIRVSLSVL